MSLSGNIRTFPLTDLLQWFSLARKSGQLTLMGDSGLNRLYIRQGVLLTATSTEPARRIGQFLLSRGYLREEGLKSALDLQEKDCGEHKLGEILCRAGHIQNDLLAKALEERTREIVFDLFLAEDGRFIFEDSDSFPEITVELNLSLDMLVLEGIRRKDEWQRIREVLPDDETRVRLLPGVEPRDDGGGEYCPALLPLLAESQSVAELVVKSRLSSFLVYRTLFQLLEQECLEITAAAAGAGSGGPAVKDLQTLEDEIRRLVSGLDYGRARSILMELGDRVLDQEWLEKMGNWLDREEYGFLRAQLPAYRIPALAADTGRLRREEMSPREGFLLSRLEEGMNIKTLCQVMPLGEGEILRILYSFLQRGLIRLVTV